MDTKIAHDEAIRAVVELLDSWLIGDDEDEREQRETWNLLKTKLNDDRLSDRDRVV